MNYDVRVNLRFNDSKIIYIYVCVCMCVCVCVCGCEVTLNVMVCLILIENQIIMKLVQNKITRSLNY